MKRYSIIILSLITFFVALASIAWIYNSSILRYVLIKSVGDITNGEISLSLDEIEYNPLSSSIKLKNITLSTNNSTMEFERRSSIHSIRFDSVLINEFGLWQLISNKIVKAGEVLTAKPELVFWQTNTTIDTAVRLVQQLNLLRKYTPKSLIPLEIDTLRLKYGTLEFRNDSTKLITGSADFSVELFDFNTINNHLNKDHSSVLFSEHIVIDISNVFQKLKNGRILRLKKLEFNSRNENLKLSSTSLTGMGKGVIDTIMIGSLLIDGIGINELGNFENIKLGSISVDSSYLGLCPHRKRLNSNFSYEQVSVELVSLLKSFQVGKIEVNNIDIDGYDNSNKLYEIKGMSLNIENIKLDSTFIVNELYPKIEKSDFQIENLMIHENINIDVSDLLYNSETALLEMRSFQHADLNLNNIVADKIVVSNILMQNLFKSNPDTNLSVTLYNPNITYHIQDKDNNRALKLDNQFIRNIFLSKLKIENGNFDIYKSKDYELDLKKVYCIVDLNKMLSLNAVSSKNYIESLSWETGEINFSDKSAGLKLNVKSTNYDGDNLYIVDGKLDHITENQFVDSLLLTWKNINFHDFNLIKSYYDESFFCQNINIIDPNVDLRLNIAYQPKDTIGFGNNINLPILIKIANATVENGILVFGFNDNDNQQLSSGFNINVKNIISSGSLKIQEVFSYNIDAEFDNFIYYDENLVVNSNEIQIATSDSTILIDKLGVEANNFEISSLSDINGNIKIEKLSLDDLFINELFMDNNIHFEGIKIKEPELNLSFEINSNSKESGNSHFEFKDKFNIDKLDITKWNADVKFVSSDTYNSINLKHSDIKWISLPNNSSLDELFVSMSEFSFQKDTILKLNITGINTDFNNDDLRFENFKLTSTNPNTNSIIKLDVPGLQISNFFIGKDDPSIVNINKLRADTLFLKIKSKQSKSGTFKIKDFEKDLSDVFKELYINELYISDAGIQFLSHEDSTNNNRELLNFKIALHKLGYKLGDSLKIIPDFVDISLKDNFFLSENGLYKYTIGDLRYNFLDNSFIVDSVGLIPTMDVDDYFKHFGYQVDRFALSSGKIIGEGFNLDDYLINNTLDIHKLMFNEISAEIYRDKTYEFKTGIVKPMPAEFVKMIELPIMIDSLIVNNSKILYGEYVNKSKVPGVVYFDNFDLKASNITNIKTNISKNNILNVFLNTSIMGQPRLDAQMKIFLDQPDRFSFKGRTEEMDFGIFNSMTENLFGISIIKGRGSFDINEIIATDSLSKGFLTFEYKKLRIALYDRNKAELTKGVASPFFKFLVNDLLIKSNNPRLLGNTRQGLIYYTRDEERSFLNYMWKSVVSGIMSTMWHNSKEQRKEKRRLKKLRNN